MHRMSKGYLPVRKHNTSMIIVYINIMLTDAQVFMNLPRQILLVKYNLKAYM
jgi:hypothetical protein